MKKSFLILSVAFAIFAISCSEDPKPADPDDPGTEQPEDPGTEQPEDPADEEVTDLNASNPETANCYIISKGGRYCFNATVMGNGNDGLMESFDTKTTAIEPTKAVLVWEDTGGLITDVELVDGKLYFSFFRPAALIRGLGGIRMTRILFDDFRRRTAEAGLGELNLDAVFYSFDPQMNRADLNREIRDAGFDSCSNYSNLRGKGFPSFEYDVMTDLNDAEMRRITRLLDVPYHPVITTGFDNSPRTVQSDMYENIGYPFTSVAVNNTPEAWERCLRLARSFTQSEEFSGQLLHLSCWNEWTEGAYLEPDTRYGTGKLDAVLRVFGRGNETTGTKEHSR